jgi:hypothetical protein
MVSDLNKIPLSERYRLYIDESGDHVCKNVEQPHRRYLCLLGCIFKNSDHSVFRLKAAALKEKHFDYDADEPVIFHREDMVNARGHFKIFVDLKRREQFNEDLIELISSANFLTFGVVIDKLLLTKNYQKPMHPYHLAIKFVLQRYCGFLNSESAVGDVLAESRGGNEDKLLKSEFESVYNCGAFSDPASFFHKTLTGHELKLKPKIVDIPGLQLCDMLGNPLRHHVLLRHNRVTQPLSDFDSRIVRAIGKKLHRHIHDGKIQDTGHVLWPLK